MIPHDPMYPLNALPAISSFWIYLAQSWNRQWSKHWNGALALEHRSRLPGGHKRSGPRRRLVTKILNLPMALFSQRLWKYNHLSWDHIDGGIFGLRPLVSIWLTRPEHTLRHWLPYNVIKNIQILSLWHKKSWMNQGLPLSWGCTGNAKCQISEA